MSSLNGGDRLPGRKNIEGSWLVFHKGVFSACKSIRIVDYYAKFGAKRNDVYECVDEESLTKAKSWLGSNMEGLLNTVPTKIVGDQGASRVRFVLLAYSSKQANEESLMFEVPIGVLLKGFDRKEFEALAEGWGASPID